MGGRQHWDEKRRQRGRLGRGVFVAYLVAGTVVAISRAGLYVWLNDVYASQVPFPEIVPYVEWALHPEALLGAYTPLGQIEVTHTQANLMWGSILAVGSFIMTTPILLVGWLIRRRQ